MGLLSSWIIGIVAASLLLAIAAAASPEGPVKRAVRFAGGLVLFVAILAPLKSADSLELAFYTQQYRADYEEYEQALIYENSVMVKEIIQDRTRTYILQKADSLGLTCEVEVEMETPEGNGYPYPVGVTITASGATAEQKSELMRFLSAELGIASDRRIWREQ